MSVLKKNLYPNFFKSNPSAGLRQQIASAQIRQLRGSSEFQSIGISFYSSLGTWHHKSGKTSRLVELHADNPDISPYYPESPTTPPVADEGKKSEKTSLGATPVVRCKGTFTEYRIQ